ncbi:MAG: beta-carotene hydroxylase, partial [Merismopedia sp. SIO2A8]|nr:beta-carotene hydroxylase [Merismopedia sp. SIO2A8]
MSVATRPLAVAKATVPRELLGPGEEFFNPNLIMFLVAVGLVALSVAGYFQWTWPSWALFCLNVTALHLVGTVIHDASHHVAHRNRLLNAALGHGSALLLGFSFPVL